MSVPRPAMLVAIVTAEALPACATISASFLCSFALSTWCSILRNFNIFDNNSEVSTSVVPINTGLFSAINRSTSLITAANFSLFVLYIKSSLSCRITGRFVGIVTTSNL